MALRIRSFQEPGLVLGTRRRARFTVAYGEILTAEQTRRGLRLHTRTSITPIAVSVAKTDRLAVEDRLRAYGVRIVDCWGAIVTITLADFEDELAREPVRLRQSSDNA